MEGSLNTSHVIFTLAALLGIVACGRPTESGPAQADRTLPPIELTELYVVGSAEGEEASAFGRIAGVAFDQFDNLYVLDQQNHRVVVFDNAGRLLRHYGKEGQGPGEFTNATDLAVASNNTVIVSDAQNRAFVVFDSTGDHLVNVTFGDLARPTNDGLIALDDTSIVVLTVGQRRGSKQFAKLVAVPLRDNAQYFRSIR
jgi:hypothetical protein